MDKVCSYCYETKNEEETLKLAQHMGERCVGGEVFALIGELGAGKTQFAKGIARGLNILDKEVTSPTFVISQLHTKGRLPFIHLDLYRLPEATELEDIGWYDFLKMEGVIVVEWAEKIKHLLSLEETIFVEITYSDDDNSGKRHFSITCKERYTYLFA